MTEAQQTALEGLVRRSLTAGEIVAIDALLPARNDVAIAALLSVGREKIVTRMVGERGIKSLACLPRHYHALLQTLKDAQTATPSWFSPVLTAAGIAADDIPALADDLGCAYGWLKQDAGLDVGAAGVRKMLDAIAVGVPLALPACAAAKALAVHPDPIGVNAVSDALNGAVQ